MNVLQISRKTTNAEISAFCEANPQYDRKVIQAQAQHERRVKRIEHRKDRQGMEDGNYGEKVRPQYRHSIFDRS